MIEIIKKKIELKIQNILKKEIKSIMKKIKNGYQKKIKKKYNVLFVIVQLEKMV